MDDKREEPENAADDGIEAGRRQALLKIGKYGAYVAPAVLAVVLGKDADAVNCGSIC